MPSVHHSLAKYFLPSATSAFAFAALSAAGSVVATITGTVTVVYRSRGAGGGGGGGCTAGASSRGAITKKYVAAPVAASANSTSAITNQARELGAVGRTYERSCFAASFGSITELPTSIGMSADGSALAFGSTAVLSAALRPPSAASSASDIAIAEANRSAGQLLQRARDDLLERAVVARRDIGEPRRRLRPSAS